MELGHDFAGRADIIAGETLDDLAGGIAEQEGLYVFPVPVQGIYTVFFPVMGKYLVLAGDEGLEVHQDGYRFARDVPVADPHAQPFVRCKLPPGFEKIVVYNEFRILTGVHPNVRSNVYMSVF